MNEPHSPMWKLLWHDIRRSVLVQIVAVLESYGKEISIEWV